MSEPPLTPLPVDRKNIKQPPLLFDDTQDIITAIEKEIGRKLLVYWTSDRGSVCDNDVVALYEIFKHIGRSEDIALFIKSNGGDVEASLRLVNLMREYNTRVHALVPLESASAATMIALGADEIEMGPLAHLTAIDSSMVHDMSPIDERNNRRVSVSQDELARIVALWNANSKEHHGNPYTDIFQYIHPLVVGAIDRSSSLSIKICKEILSFHIKDEAECDRISKLLNSDYPSHSYPITTREAKRIGLKVSSLNPVVNDLLLDLNSLYSEMAQKALTDFNEYNYHDNEIINIHETQGIQIYFQNDKDWNYIQAERRWQTLNDESSWRMTKRVKGKTVLSILHIR
jgi:ATP-dependent protease ClpP protease subunit